jgi:hypothetical protein
LTARRPDPTPDPPGPATPGLSVEPLEPRLLFSASTDTLANGDDNAGHGSGCACAGCCAGTHALLGGTLGHTHDHGAMNADGVFFDPVSMFTGPGGLPDNAGPATAPDPTGARSGGTYALSEVPALHSNPGSDRVIYLDFNGMTVQGTYWNSVYHGNQAIHAPAFDLDGDISSFNQAEIDQIHEVWQRVAEDYAPFDIDVTTEEPPASAFTAGSRAIRVLISSNVDHAQLGGDGTKWYPDAGGVARVGSWQYTSDTPAWVFSNLLLGSAKNVAESASHEAGHTFGLTHDGTSSGETYYTGHGSGATSWAPIMGSAYDHAVTQWSRGEYNNSNNTQDDLAVITQSANGVRFHADDHADHRFDASLIRPLFGSRSVGASGLIATATDIDFFAFDTGSGTVHLTVSPAEVGANLDLRARLYNASGSVLATSSPSGSLGASFDLSLAAGRYYLSVEGVGHGSPGSTGYSDYASLGRYHLVGSIPPTDDLALPAPLAGDADGDYAVGAGDLDAVIASWGQAGDLPADLNHDGVVGIADLDLLLAHWGDSADVPTEGVSRYWVPTHGGLGLSWVQPGFDDSAWLPSVLGLGYETTGSNYAPLIATQVPAPAASVYLRSSFDLGSVGGIDGLGLTIRYDDGFVAYLNGVAVAWDNAEPDADWNDAATDSPPDSEAERFKWFDLSAFAGLLQPAGNTLAIHLLNRSAGNNDLLLEAELVTWSNPAAGRSGQADPPSDPPPSRGALAGDAASGASAKQRWVAAEWSRRIGRDAPDALAATPAPTPKRGTAGTPRHVADLLR